MVAVTKRPDAFQDAPNRIKEIRMRRGMSLSELSELTGFTRSELHKLEKGVRRIRTDHLPALAKALRCDPEELLHPELAEELVGYRLKYGEGQTTPAESATADLPVYGTLQDNGSFTMDEENPNALVNRPASLKSVKNAYAVYMPTSALEPQVPVASLMYVSPVMPARPGDVAIVRHENKTAEIIRVQAGQSFGSTTKVHRVIGVMFA